MIKNRKGTTFFTHCALLSLLLFLWSIPALAVSKNDLTRTNEDGAVEVSVLYLNPLKTVENGVLVFEVKLNTHSVNLDQYQFAEIAYLQIDSNPPRESIGWFDAKGRGHHLSGVLKFGGSFPESAKRMKLVIKGVDGVAERAFEWRRPLN